MSLGTWAGRGWSTLLSEANSENVPLSGRRRSQDRRYRALAGRTACAASPDLASFRPAIAVEQQDGVVARPVLSIEPIDLAPMTLERLPLLVELDADPEVLRHILGRARSAAEVHD